LVVAMHYLFKTTAPQDTASLVYSGHTEPLFDCLDLYCQSVFPDATDNGFFKYLPLGQPAVLVEVREDACKRAIGKRAIAIVRRNDQYTGSRRSVQQGCQWSIVQYSECLHYFEIQKLTCCTVAEITMDAFSSHIERVFNFTISNADSLVVQLCCLYNLFAS
jgi:hypothetical protein